MSSQRGKPLHKLSQRGKLLHKPSQRGKSPHMSSQRGKSPHSLPETQITSQALPKEKIISLHKPTQRGKSHHKSSLIVESLHKPFLQSSSGTGIKLPPGKTSWPVIGESLEFLSTGWKGHPEKFIFDRMSKYSSNVFKTSLLKEKTAVFCGAEGNKFLFSNENKLVQAWWPASIDKIFPPANENQLNSSKKEAIVLRKMLPNFLKPEALRGYIGIMDQITERHFASSWDNKDEVVVFPLAKRFTFWLACRLFMSIEDPNDVEKFADPFEHIVSGLFSIPINLPGTPFRRGIKASSYIRKELVLIIKQRKIDLAEGKATPTQDILSHMLSTSDEDGNFRNELDIANKIMALLIGGHDTASSACTFILKYLAELPDVYDKVYNDTPIRDPRKNPNDLRGLLFWVRDPPEDPVLH
ncbi:hypothetical protein LguiB_005418 [Lonicera macranthoides]